MRVVTKDGKVVFGLDRVNGLFVQVWGNDNSLILAADQFYPATSYERFDFNKIKKHLNEAQLKEINETPLPSTIYVYGENLRSKGALRTIGEYLEHYSKYLKKLKEKKANLKQLIYSSDEFTFDLVEILEGIV